MAFELNFTQTSVNHIRGFRKFEQRMILDSIEEQLRHEPTTETRNRKRLGENELSDWELRVQQFRVFYDVHIDDEKQVVKIKAVGWKEHNTLKIGGKETRL
jgi:mRNA-degrading endonuclease RelE of RelBE toxin-antitoxin system